MTSAAVSRNCPVCGRSEAAPWLVKGELRLGRCRACGMIYASPVLAEFASGAYYDQAGAGYYVSPAKLEGDYAPTRFARELRLFRRHCQAGSVLDVGCSSGAFLYQLQQRFPGQYARLGTDASGPALEHARSRGVPMVSGDFRTQDFGGRRFDAVTFWAVLEHLSEPRAFVEKAWSALRDEGLCFVLVPNMQSLAARWLGRRWRYVYPQHLNYFTRATLAKLVEDRFSVVEWRTTHFNPIVLWQDFRRGGAEISNEERAALLRRTTGYKENPALKPARLLYGAAERALGALGLADNLAVVLRKRAKRGA